MCQQKICVSIGKHTYGHDMEPFFRGLIRPTALGVDIRASYTHANPQTAEQRKPFVGRGGGEAEKLGRRRGERGYHDLIRKRVGRGGAHGCQMAIAKFFRFYAFGPSGLKDYGSAMLRYKICHLATLVEGRKFLIMERK